ncbi:MAG: bifunctional D-glycero-beta-D-manno-heptose-7-phosphate kinase/D-glycero-beta-D-manno-heptose 1-phosphate adenylyltransferase HldE [Pantoea sp. Brub]|nr:bifunctional D-glycero-beta-D-manno-heptose-7-phosphate kinase/D-glycero-beta-D-manno-heptose 1-phosphate adenylyltransferase HldE [Pantoea sp. Brub]
MKITLPIFNKTSVLIIGDIILDRYCHGFATHISPEAPVPIVKINYIEECPGGAANVAMNVTALNAKSFLIGITGQDNSANILTKMLKKFNINYDFLSIKNYSTITKLRILSHNQQLIRLDFEKKITKIMSKLIINKIYKNIANVDILVLSDYAKGTLKNVQDMIMLAKKAQIPILIDPKGKDFSRYRGATLLTPNLLEFEAVVGKCKNEKDIIKRGMLLIKKYNLSGLLVTRAEDGMILLQPDKTPFNLPAQTQKASDVTGAGDTVIAVLSVAIASGSSLEEACFLANIAAGLAIKKIGTSIVNKLEFEKFIYDKYHKQVFGILDQIQLKNVVNISRKKGEKIVMTNGVFDILHPGHISYLNNARKLGDRLIVAVNSDDSTKRLKGKNRPINSQNNRMIVLSALKSVDWVVVFEEDTPQQLISEILPDLLVKGGDYSITDIVGSKEVLANGGEVRILKFEKCTSTTDIIKIISNN